MRDAAVGHQCAECVGEEAKTVEREGDTVVITGNEMLQDQMAVVTKPILRN